MAAITGSDTVVGLKLGSTFGTAVAIGAGDVFYCEGISKNESTTELTTQSIGAGTVMTTQSDKGFTTTSVPINGYAGYEDSRLAGLGQLFGTDTVTDNGDTSYTHAFTVNETFNAKYATIAHQVFNAGTFEYPSCSATSVTFSTDSVPNYVTQDQEFLADEKVINSSTNTYATLASASVDKNELVVCQQASEFLINLQGGGALSKTTDLVSITGFTFTLNRPQESPSEIKGSAGNGEPVSTGVPMDATFSITLRKLEDMTYFTAFDAGTEYKASLGIVGGEITTGVDYAWTLSIPRMKIVQSPDFNVSDAGNNPLTVNFKVLVASANPTGMGSTYPFLEVTNEQTAAYIS